MKNFFKLLFTVLGILLFFSCGKEDIIIDKLEIPTGIENEIIEHFAYTLSYNEKHEQADWVAYELTKENVLSNIYERTDNFRADDHVLTGSATLSDYQNSGYDRGHLMPAADNSWSETAMSESFYLSNMSPQVAQFNRGEWVKLENRVRIWAEIYDGVYISAGGVLTDNLPTIGENKVSVPKYFFKVILDYSGKKAIGFIMPNIDIEDNFKNYAVSIDSVEKYTGINFFHKLPDETEEKIERTVNISEWDFNEN